MGGGAVAIATALKWGVTVLLERIDRFADHNQAEHEQTRSDISKFEAHVNEKLGDHDRRIYRIEDRFLPIGPQEDDEQK